MVIEGLDIADNTMFIVFVSSVYLFYYLFFRPGRVYIFLHRLYYLRLGDSYLNCICSILVLAFYHPSKCPISQLFRNPISMVQSFSFPVVKVGCLVPSPCWWWTGVTFWTPRTRITGRRRAGGTGGRGVGSAGGGVIIFFWFVVSASRRRRIIVPE